MARFSPLHLRNLLQAYIMTTLFILGLIAVALYLFPEPILRPVGSFLVVNDLAEKSSAVVILLGGESPERVLRALELYQAGTADRFVFGTGFVDRDIDSKIMWSAGGERYRQALLSMGVPDSDMVLVDTSECFDTNCELSKIASYAKKNSLSSVILVSAASHTRRVKLIWDRVANGDGSERKDFVVAARPERLNDWWRNGRAIREVAYEIGALTKELVRRIS